MFPSWKHMPHTRKLSLKKPPVSLDMFRQFDYNIID